MLVTLALLPPLATLGSFTSGVGSPTLHECADELVPSSTQEVQPFRAWLVLPADEAKGLPEAELPFGLELERAQDGWRAFLVNGEERIDVPEVSWDGSELALEMAHYDSRIRATRDEASGLLVGTWEKVRGKDRTARVAFRARPGVHERFPIRAEDGPPWNVTGRWRIDFESDEKHAVGIFEQGDDSPLVTGTVLTHTGDYHYLAGTMASNRLRLSCFDGAHAFLFDARLGEDGVLAGTFRSGDWWSERWSAVRDAEAVLEDAFDQTAWNEGFSPADLVFPDLDGELRSLAVSAPVTVLQLFGSWCPNCHDEARYLVELHERYGPRGLRIVGLAFELTGDSARDARQVRAFRERHRILYSLLLAGTADKAAATLAFGAIDRLRSFPTTIFLDYTGKVRAVHSGFVGPATGPAHERLRWEFEHRIDGLLAEFHEGAAGPYLTFPECTLEGGPVSWRETPPGTGGAVTRRVGPTSIGFDLRRGERTFELQLVESYVRTAVEIRAEEAILPEFRLPWRWDERAGVLIDPLEVGHRFVLDSGDDGATWSPLLAERGIEGRPALELALHDPDPIVRREAVLAWAFLPDARAADAAPLLACLDDADPRVVSVAVWSAGWLGLEAVRERATAFLEHPDPRLRREARRALERLGGAAR